MEDTVESEAVMTEETETAKAIVMNTGHRFVRMIRIAAAQEWTTRMDGRTALLKVAEILEQTTEDVTT